MPLPVKPVSTAKSVVPLTAEAVTKPLVRSGRGTYRVSTAFLKLTAVAFLWAWAILMTPWTMFTSHIVAFAGTMLILG